MLLKGSGRPAFRKLFMDFVSNIFQLIDKNWQSKKFKISFFSIVRAELRVTAIYLQIKQYVKRYDIHFISQFYWPFIPAFISISQVKTAIPTSLRPETRGSILTFPAISVYLNYKLKISVQNFMTFLNYIYKQN